MGISGAAAPFGAGEFTTGARVDVVVGVAGGGVGGSGAAASVIGGRVAANCFDAGAPPPAGDDAVLRFAGVEAGCRATPVAKLTAFTIATGDVVEIVDADAQPVSTNIELTDTKNRRSCLIVVARPF